MHAHLPRQHPSLSYTQHQMTKTTTSSGNKSDRGRLIAKRTMPTNCLVHRLPLRFNVAGVTFDGHQALLRRCAASGVASCTLRLDPVSNVDPDAVSVRMVLDDEIVRVGFVPRRLSDQVRVGQANVVTIDTFTPTGSGSVWYCTIEAERA